MQSNRFKTAKYCDKREVLTYDLLSDALLAAAAINRCVWAQVSDRLYILYKVYPGGRMVQYNVKVPWTKGRPTIVTAKE